MSVTLKYIAVGVVVAVLILGYKASEDNSAEPGAEVDPSQSEKVEGAASVPEGASLEEFAEAAVSGTKIDITGCKLEPSSISIAEGATFSVVNNDSVPRTLVVGKDRGYTVKAKSERYLKADFGKGTISLGCDTPGNIKGAIVVK